jgi:hypothetical protein
MLQLLCKFDTPSFGSLSHHIYIFFFAKLSFNQDLPVQYYSIMQYGGNQQRILNMMMQARQQQGRRQQQSTVQPSIYAGYPALPPHGIAAQQQRIMPAPTFVTCVTENDVLLGRGTPCAENEGNVRFRRLVKDRKVEYIAADKRMRKDAIAREILEVIAARGGKFLRRLESIAELELLGVPPGYHTKEVWAVVDEDTQVQKVKQALRNKDDAAELLQTASGNNEESSSSKYNEQDVTNRFPRGANNESDIHKADCTFKFGTGLLERASSGSSAEGKTAGSPKLKGKAKPPRGGKTTSKVMQGEEGASTRRFEGLLPSTLDSFANAPRRASLEQAAAAMASPGNQRNVLNSLPSTSRQLWDKSQAAPSEVEMIRLQEMQRLRLMQKQIGAGHTGMGVGVAGFSGLGPSIGALNAAGIYSPGDLQRAQIMNVEYLQMQAAQQQQMHMVAAAAREQAAITGLMGPSAALHPSMAMTARQLQVETAQRRASLSVSAGAEAMAVPPQVAKGATKAKAGAESAGERAIGIAQAMKRAEAFPPADSLEMSHLETLILSVLCSHGLPVWTPEAHTKSFVALPTFAKRLDWTWYGFASVLKQMANSSGWKKNSSSGSGQPMDAIDRMATEAAGEYRRDPRELAAKTIMLLEKLRRHGSASTSTSQRKQYSGLGMRVPLWLDRELSRWAMTLDIADPAGRPVPFSSAEFVAEHAEYKGAPALVATAAFDPQLADDVIDQVALITRLRSVFVKTKGHEIKAKIEGAIKKTEAAGESWKDQPRGWDSGDKDSTIVREILLCDRLLSEGFSGVMSSSSDLGTEYQIVSQTGARGGVNIAIQDAYLVDIVCFARLLSRQGSSARTYPTFDSLSLTKSAVQQRVNQITKELHAMDEAKDLSSLRLYRMERMAQCVLSSPGVDPSGAVLGTSLILHEGSPGGTKRRESATTLDLPSNKKQMT